MKEDYDGNYRRGIKAENFFASLLNARGIQYNYINTWYDYVVWNNQEKLHKVEVKSCKLTTKQGKGYRAGRFNFYPQKEREAIFKENIWVCFVLRYQEQFVLLGFCRAKELENKRWINMHQLDKYGIISFDKWIKEIM